MGFRERVYRGRNLSILFALFLALCLLTFIILPPTPKVVATIPALFGLCATATAVLGLRRAIHINKKSALRKRP